MHRYERYDRNLIFGRLGRSLRVQLGLYARRPRRDGGPERRFFVFAQGRTGSTLLAALLGAHPDVQCDHEILSVPVFSPLRYVQRMSLICPARVHGFRVKIYQLTGIQRMRQPREFVLALHEAGYRIIHLKRENLLRQSVSNLFALANRRYHYKSGDDRRVGTISVDCRRVVEMIEKRLRYADDEERVVAEANQDGRASLRPRLVALAHGRPLGGEADQDGVLGAGLWGLTLEEVIVA